MLKPELYTAYSDPEQPDLPSILIIAGTHGNETSALWSAWFLKNMLSTGDLLGGIRGKYSRISFLLGINPTGLAANEREWQETGKGIPCDLNRAFSIRNDDFSRESIVGMVKSAINDHNVIIDIHNSPNIVDCILINNDLLARSYVEWCEKSGIKYILRDNCSDTIKKYANDLGKMGITVELNSMGYCNEANLSSSVLFITNLITQVSAYVSNWPEPQRSALPVAMNSIEMCAHADGLIKYAADNAFKHYDKGELIAKICDYSMNPLESPRQCNEEILAPCDGYLMCVNPSLYQESGCYFATFQPDIKA